MGEEFSFSGSAFTFEIGCHGDCLGVEIDDDGDDAAIKHGLRLDCCCC